MTAKDIRAANLRDPELCRAYAACESFLRRDFVKHYLPLRQLLPPGRRPYWDAILAFSIHVDNLIDDARVPVPQRTVRYDAYTRDFFALLDGEDPWTGPPSSRQDRLGRTFARAFAHFTRVWDIPRDSVRPALTNIAADLRVTEYASFPDLERHIRSTGGEHTLWLNALLGSRAHRSEEAREHAVSALLGLQLTDNLRDLREDLADGRLFLPLDDLKAFGLDRAELEAAAQDRRMTDSLRDLVRFEAERARGYLDRAADWWRWADAGSRELPRQYVSMARCVLRQVPHSRHDVFHPPALRGRLACVTAAGAGLALGYARRTATRRFTSPGDKADPAHAPEGSRPS
ncbi:squalene/phytoene synthase family protein [Streptomyces sp. NPDC017260]|uniref:squalene/phytoene synthase family protein n=1 Tax=unclassified Streptomyces TaxID=2593676 RepID=UPI0037BBB9DE